MISVGIVGLPNVGKSTLFNALTKNEAEASNYPFCTIDPNVGIVAVPDKRLYEIESVVPTQKIVPAVVEFVDIAGIIKGASEGEGLGNKFLANIRECETICEVIRVFEDHNVTHVAGDINPLSDIETIKTELALADLETLGKKLEALRKEAKGNKEAAVKVKLAEKIYEHLEKGIPARKVNFDEEELIILKEFQLLTAKPHLYALNVSENHLRDSKFQENLIKKMDLNENEYVFVSAKVEADLNVLSEEEKEEYLAEIGQGESGLSRLVQKSYGLLGLQTYFTAGEKEIRAWTIKKGWTAKQAAGVIHTDFEKGFIKAETVTTHDLVTAGGWQKAKEAGKVRLEGKDYIVQDGDIMIFKFSS